MTDENTAPPDEQPTSGAVELGEPAELSEPAATDEAGDQKAEPSRRGGVVRSVLAGIRRNLAVVATVAALLVSATAAAVLYFTQYRVDEQTDAAAAEVALEAAKNGSVALLSYSPESLDKDFAAAKANLTGDFLSYYTQFTEQIVTPAAKEKQVKTAAAVVRGAISEIHPDSATALLFINQTTTSKENPDGAFAASAVKVGLTKVDGRWLINAFDPV